MVAVGGLRGCVLLGVLLMRIGRVVLVGAWVGGVAIDTC